MIRNDDPFLNPDTLRLLEIRPGVVGRPRSFAATRQRLFFFGDDGVNGDALWWSDGRRVVPTGVRDQTWNPAPGLTYANGDWTGLGDELFFKGYNASSGWELWRHDGSNATLFQDITPPIGDLGNSSGSFGPKQLTTAGSNIFYFAPILRTFDNTGDGVPDIINYDSYLWRSDGTEAGTQPLSFISSPNISSTFAADSYFYFTIPGSRVHSLDLWRSDGTVAGTVPITAVSTASFAVANVGTNLFYTSSDDIHGAELWFTDGSIAGTRFVKDISPGVAGSTSSGGSGPGRAVIGNTLYFRADDSSHGEELWKSDGTSAGTVLVADIIPGAGGSGLYWFAAAGNTVYFSALDRLWKSDGTASGTVPVVGMSDGPFENGPFRPEWLTTVGNTIYFTAQTPYSSSLAAPRGRELWKSDGTARGTRLVADINQSGGSYPDSLKLVGSTLYFVANDGLNGQELWSLDVTADLFTTIESQGNTSLLRGITDGKAVVGVGADRYTVASPFGLGTGDASSEWQMLAAETVGGQNQILWRNNPGNFLHLWNLNSAWAWQSSSGNTNPNSSGGWTLETQFQVDANNDGIIGVPFSTIENQGNTSLLRGITDGKAVVGVGADRYTVASPFGLGTGDASSEWQM
ncbi:MAG: ELWxxDGT repeat protein, partial [Cyanobium sp.]